LAIEWGLPFVPKDSSLSLPSKRYLNGHTFPPNGMTRRSSPPLFVPERGVIRLGMMPNSFEADGLCVGYVPSEPIPNMPDADGFHIAAPDARSRPVRLFSVCD